MWTGNRRGTRETPVPQEPACRRQRPVGVHCRFRKFPNVQVLVTHSTVMHAELADEGQSLPQRVASVACGPFDKGPAQTLLRASVRDAEVYETPHRWFHCQAHTLATRVPVTSGCGSAHCHSPDQVAPAEWTSQRLSLPKLQCSSTAMCSAIRHAQSSSTAHTLCSPTTVLEVLINTILSSAVQGGSNDKPFTPPDGVAARCQTPSKPNVRATVLSLKARLRRCGHTITTNKLYASGRPCC